MLDNEDVKHILYAILVLLGLIILLLFWLLCLIIVIYHQNVFLGVCWCIVTLIIANACTDSPW